MVLAILILIAGVVALIASLWMAARGERATGAIISGAVGVVGALIGMFTWLGFDYFLLLLLGVVAIVLGLLARREGGRGVTGAILGGLTLGLFALGMGLGLQGG